MNKQILFASSGASSSGGGGASGTLTLGGLYGQFFSGDWRSVINTGNIGTLPLSSPTFYSSISYSEQGEYYGFIAIGYFVPPTTGTYTFYTSSDDGSGVWIGENASATSGRTTANAVVDNGMGSGQGDTKRSGTISLTAGEPYAIRIVHEEGWGGDNLTFSWSGPGIAETTDLSQNFYYLASGNNYGTIVGWTWSGGGGGGGGPNPNQTPPSDTTNAVYSSGGTNPANWTDQSLGSQYFISYNRLHGYDLSYSNGEYFTCSSMSGDITGDTGTVLGATSGNGGLLAKTSDNFFNPRSWTGSRQEQWNLGLQIWKCCIKLDNGTYVASNGYNTWYSTDFQTWTPVTVSGTTTRGDAAMGARRFIKIGSYVLGVGGNTTAPCIGYTSATDGTTWTINSMAVVNGTHGNTSNVPADGVGMKGVAYSDTLGIVAVGSGSSTLGSNVANSYYSDDPTGTFSSNRIGIASGSAGTPLYSVAVSDTTFCAVGYGGAAAIPVIYTSTNKINWTASTYPTSSHTGANLISITYGSGKFVAVGYKGTAAISGGLIIYSTDNGATWTQVPETNIPTCSKWTSILWDGYKFSIVGSDMTIIWSTNGIDWELAHTCLPINDIAYNKNNHKYMVGLYNSNTVVYCNDDFTYFRAKNLPGNTNGLFSPKPVYLDQGYWYANHPGTTTLYRSSDNGVTWSTVTLSHTTNAIASNGDLNGSWAGHGVAICGGGTSLTGVSGSDCSWTNDGVNWSPVSWGTSYGGSGTILDIKYARGKFIGVGTAYFTADDDNMSPTTGLWNRHSTGLVTGVSYSKDKWHAYDRYRGATFPNYLVTNPPLVNGTATAETAPLHNMVHTSDVWDGDSWTQIGGGAIGANPTMNFKYIASLNKFYVRGYLGSANTVSAIRIDADGNNWSQWMNNSTLSSTNASLRTLTLTEYDDNGNGLMFMACSLSGSNAYSNDQGATIAATITTASVPGTPNQRPGTVLYRAGFWQFGYAGSIGIRPTWSNDPLTSMTTWPAGASPIIPNGTPGYLFYAPTDRGIGIGNGYWYWIYPPSGGQDSGLRHSNTGQAVTGSSSTTEGVTSTHFWSRNAVNYAGRRIVYSGDRAGYGTAVGGTTTNWASRPVALSIAGGGNGSNTDSFVIAVTNTGNTLGRFYVGDGSGTTSGAGVWTYYRAGGSTANFNGNYNKADFNRFSEKEGYGVIYAMCNNWSLWKTDRTNLTTGWEYVPTNFPYTFGALGDFVDVGDETVHLGGTWNYAGTNSTGFWYLRVDQTINVTSGGLYTPLYGYAGHQTSFFDASAPYTWSLLTRGYKFYKDWDSWSILFGHGGAIFRTT